MSQAEVVLARLDDQIGWYDKQSARNKRIFIRLKTTTLVISV
jgi:hypothetical protein